MNEFLAEMYGTREAIGAPNDNEDVEKLAEAQLLDEALQAEGINIDELPGDTIVKLAYQILGEDSHIVKAAMTEAGEEGEAPPKKEGKKDDEEPMEEKVAQADFLGRVMAHSYVNELGEIEKNAGPVWEAAKGMGRALKDVPGRAWTAGPYRAGQALKRKGRAMKGSFEGGKYMERSGGRAGGWVERETPSTAKGLAGVAREHPGTVGGAALGLAGAGAGGAYAAKGKGKKKAASAIDMLAEKRAMEWAESVGLVESDENEKLAAAVDQRAYEMLLEQGVDVDAIEASLQG